MLTRIEGVAAREVLDSRGRPTVEADVVLAGGARGRASVPSGASTGRHEAVELRDGAARRFGGFGVLAAVLNIREQIAPAVVGCDAANQSELDALLIALDGTPDKSKLGANALLAVSLAAARAAAAAAGSPVWRTLGADPLLPLPMVNVVSGGRHAPQGLAFQDFLVVPVGARSFADAIEQVYAVRAAVERLLSEQGQTTLKADEGGFGPPLEAPEQALDLIVEGAARAECEVGIAIDVAASQLVRGDTYELPGAGTFDAATLVAELERLVGDYPIVSIEDGLGEDDWEGWTILSERLGARIQLIGDDLFTTNLARLERGMTAGIANAVLVKMNQIGTLTETVTVIERARAAGYATIVSARSGETEDSFLADLAVGTGAGQIKVGSLAQSERLAKYNELLRIEEALGVEGRFAGRDALARPVACLQP